MTLAPEAAPAAPAAAPASRPAAPASSAADAVERLFRVSIRAGRVHPLQHVLQRYRAGERA